MSPMHITTPRNCLLSVWVLGSAPWMGPLGCATVVLLASDLKVVLLRISWVFTQKLKHRQGL